MASDGLPHCIAIYPDKPEPLWSADGSYGDRRYRNCTICSGAIMLRPLGLFHTLSTVTPTTTITVVLLGDNQNRPHEYPACIRSRIRVRWCMEQRLLVSG
jgi:hypothetical protein